jgi:XTP/dITP diphosphohydrolase
VPVTPALSLILATRNGHKVREIGRMLACAGVVVEPLPAGTDLPPERGATFAANALPKARTAANITGRISIGDDSGIEAAALDGAPGVLSARYAGPGADDERNLRKLMAEVPAGTRLRYVCVIAVVDPADGSEVLLRGECEGRMCATRRGTRGFGYDPIFLPDEDAQNRTMAELSDDEKDMISHRGQAARALVAHLRGTGRLGP